MKLPLSFPHFWIPLVLLVLGGFILNLSGQKLEEEALSFYESSTAGAETCQLNSLITEYLSCTAQILGDRYDHQFYREAINETAARFSQSSVPEISAVAQESKRVFFELAKSEEINESLLEALEFLNEIEESEISISAPSVTFSFSANPIDTFAETVSRTFQPYSPVDETLNPVPPNICGLFFFLLSITAGTLISRSPFGVEQIAVEEFLRCLYRVFLLVIFTLFPLDQHPPLLFCSRNILSQPYLSQRKSVVLLR